MPVKLITLLVVIFTLSGCSDKARLQPLDTDATILAYGDSLTYGTGTSRDKAYPAILEKIIHRKVINAGVPGETSQQGLLRLPALLEEHQPDLVILFHGGNDVLRKMNLVQTKQNIQQMIDLSIQNQAQVILIAVPEFGLFLQPLSLYPSLAEYNNLPLDEDTLATILRKNALKSDHIHPNSDGYQLIAENIAELLISSGGLMNH